MKDVFISYSTKDQAAKNELVALFEKEGITYWLDEIDINTIGENLANEIEEGIRQTNCTVLIVSENSLKSFWVAKEALFRLMQEKVNNENRLLPLLIDKKAFDDGFIFEVYDELDTKVKDTESNRSKAKQRNMNTQKFDIQIDRLQRILPNLTDIFQKITEGLSADLVSEQNKAVYWNKLIRTIQKIRQEKEAQNSNKREGDTIIGNGNIIIKNVQGSDIEIQQAEKMYKIDKIDTANFS